MCCGLTLGLIFEKNIPNIPNTSTCKLIFFTYVKKISSIYTTEVVLEL